MPMHDQLRSYLPSTQRFLLCRLPSVCEIAAAVVVVVLNVKFVSAVTVVILKVYPFWPILVHKAAIARYRIILRSVFMPRLLSA